MDIGTKTNVNPASAAAIVFRDVLLREIGEENKRLKDDSCFKSLLDHIQKVELVAVTNGEPIQLVRVPLNNNGDGSDSIGTPPDDDGPKPAKYETISTAYLSQGAVVVFNQGCNVESESLTIPVESSQDILLHNIGVAGMKVNVAGKSICSFPHEFFGTSKSTVVEITDNNTAHLTIHISESVLVKGILENLNDDEITAFKEMPDDTGHHMILSKYLLPLLQVNTHDGPHPTFRPTSIVMILSPMMRDVLHLVQRATAPSDAGWPFGKFSSDRLRFSTLSALGNESHINKLNENLTLKLHRDLRKMVTSVNISHIDGIMNFSVEEGSMFDSQWRIYVADKDHSSMPVNCIKDSIFYMSGTQWGNSDRKWTPQLISREGYQLVLSISNNFGVHMLGTFNWEDLPYDRIPDIVGGPETFQQRVYSSVSGLYVGNEPFPDIFWLQIKEVVFSQRSIADALVLVGLGNELVSNGAGAKSDHY